MTTFSNKLFSAVAGLAVVASAEPDAGLASGHLDKEVIRAAIRRHQSTINHCYEAVLVQGVNLTGKLVVEWDITITGAVDQVHQASSSTLNNAQVAQCVLKEISSWQFPRPVGGRVHVTYPFIVDFIGL